jgi:2-dehydro-3-deoxygluconokinase
LDVVTLGETMVLLCPEVGTSLEHSTLFTKRIAGAESNVAIGLSRLGHHVAWISQLGDDGFGRFILKTLRGEGVDVSAVGVDEIRNTGVFFKDPSSIYSSNVHYYRANSAASAITVDSNMFPVFDSSRIFHVTGITPALSQSAKEVMFSLVHRAKRNGMKITFDPNYRSKLWSLENALPVLRELSRQSDIVLPAYEEGRLITGEGTPEKIATWFLENGAHAAIVKLGPQGAYYNNGEETGYVEGFHVPFIDEIGAGDAFVAGFLSGVLDGLQIEQATRRACALGAIAVCGPGDYEMLPYRKQLNSFLSQKSRDTMR